MRIRLIQPAMHRRPMDTELKVRMSPPLGLLTLAAITPAEHDVTIENENVGPLDLDTAADLVGMSVTVDVMPRAAEIAAVFRRRGVPVVWGGVHPTCDPAGCRPYADAVCVGQGEDTWPRILADASAGRLQPVYHSRATDADLVGPAYDRIDQDAYLFTSIVSTSRGCPFRCDFCYQSADACRDVYLRRSIAAIVAEIEALDTRHVMFIDDNLAGDPAWLAELVAALRPLGVRWHAAVSATISSRPRLLDAMAAAGCQSLFIGLESLNRRSLSAVHKAHNRTERYSELVAQLHERGIMVNASFVFGLDGDGPEVFAETLDWVVDHRVETVTSHILTPYPGTVQHRRLLAEGRIIDHDLSHYDTAHVVFEPRGMTVEELATGYLWFYDQLYGLGNIWRRLPTHPRQRAAFLAFNLLYRRYGHLTERLCERLTYARVGRLARWVSYRI